MVSARLASCANAEAREHLRLQLALTERGRPSHGPLSDPEMWDAERMLGAGDTAAAHRAGSRRARRRLGATRRPCTCARALALLQGKESPRAIAQRIGAMAVSMSEFPEIELLAAQAWNAAGETRNALPFARDLASNPRVPEDLRAAAESILRAPRVPLEAPMGDRDFESSEGELRPISPARRTAAARDAAPRSRPTPVGPPPRRPPFLVAAPEIRRADAPRIARSVPPPQVVVHDSRVDLPLSRTPSEPPPKPTHADAARRRPKSRRRPSR